jgi:hypothetical protein
LVEEYNILKKGLKCTGNLYYKKRGWIKNLGLEAENIPNFVLIQEHKFLTCLAARTIEYYTKIRRAKILRKI